MLVNWKSFTKLQDQKQRQFEFVFDVSEYMKLKFVSCASNKDEKNKVYVTFCSQSTFKKLLESGLFVAKMLITPNCIQQLNKFSRHGQELYCEYWTDKTKIFVLQLTCKNTWHTVKLCPADDSSITSLEIIIRNKTVRTKKYPTQKQCFIIWKLVKLINHK